MNPFKYNILFHVAGWVIFFIVPLLLYPTHAFTTALSDPTNVLSLLIRNFLWMGLFYLNLLYLTPSLLKKKETMLLIATIVAAIIAVTLINSSIHHFFSQLLDPDSRPGGPGFGRIPPEGFPPGPPPEPGPGRGFGFHNRPRPLEFGPPGPLFSNLLISLMVASVSTSAVLWQDWVKSRAEEQERVFQKITSELAVLKLQISPHFLFNTLNNIRWLIRSGSDQAEASVIKLSHLLRYVLYQTDLEKVALEKEAQHLRDYVALQQLRLVSRESILLSVEGIQPEHLIVPLLLIPLVENVFKYGEFKETFQNTIALSVADEILKFSTVNKIISSPEIKTGKEYGIGLHNVKKRLALHYPGTHSLKILETGGVFQLDLEIILNRHQ